MEYFLQDASLETDEINKIMVHTECYNIPNGRPTSTCSTNFYLKFLETYCSMPLFDHNFYVNF